MIKKTIGIVCAAAIVALLVFTVLHRDRYRSMLFDAAERAVPAREAAAPRPATARQTDEPADGTAAQPAAAPTDAAAPAH